MHQPRIVIVGAGIIGLSTAYALLKEGIEHVVVLEQATVDHSRASSHGISRLLRFEYGDASFYSEMVNLSLQRWKNLEHSTQRMLYTPTGLLTLSSEGDYFAESSYATLRELGYAPEKLTRQACAQRFPQFNTQEYNMIMYNENAGLLHASFCLHTLKDCIRALGGEIREQHQVTHITHDNRHRPIHLQLASGDGLLADQVVVAAGPWVHRLLGELHLPVRLTQQYVLYFANLLQPTFTRPNFPAFIASDLYGFPIHATSTGLGSDWLKAASHTFGTTVDPDEVPIVDQHIITQIAQSLSNLLPALRIAELAQIDTCMYDVSLDEDFILDRLPDDPRIVFASGLTGHSFKFGLLLGELLSSLLCDTDPIVPMDPFQLSRFQHRQTPAHSVV